MQKKGTNTVSMLVTIIVALAFLAVIVAIFFGPESLYMGLRSIIPDPLEHLPIGTTTGDFGASIEKRDAVTIFDEFATAYLSLAESNADQCFLIFPQKQLKYLFEDHYIEILRDGSDTYISLDNEIGTIRRDPGASYDSAGTVIKIPGVIPCTVTGDITENFYAYWLNRDRFPEGASPVAANPANKIQLYPKYKTVVDGISSFPMDSDGSTFVLYKAEEYICIFPLANGGTKCKERTKNGMVALDDDCFNERRKDSLQQLALERNYPLFESGQCSTWNK